MRLDCRSRRQAATLFARLAASVVLCVALALPQPPAHALDIHLTSGNWTPINIFISRFGGEQQLGDNLPSEIIGDDLTRSGEFRVRRLAAPNFANVDAAYLDALGQKGGEYLLAGQLTHDPIKQEYILQFVLHDIITGKKVGSFKTAFSPANQRLAAHNVANWVLETVTAQAGVFHTKVVYVVRRPNGQSVLRVADYDGHNRQTILQSDDRIISPSWSPDGNELVYVSFERNKPIIYRQNFLTGERQVVANFRGSNSAPAISPDLQRVAAALTEHGGLQQIYLISDDGKRRVRTSNGINTEPAFSPDGTRLVFSSDEAGSLQIYQINLTTREEQRLTYNSRYNASPQYSSDGKNIVFVSRSDAGDNVVLLEIRSGREVQLTNTRLADSPTFAPNDNIILYKDEKNKNYLATVSVNGKVAVFWDTPEDGIILDPAWGPAASAWF